MQLLPQRPDFETVRSAMHAFREMTLQLVFMRAEKLCCVISNDGESMALVECEFVEEGKPTGKRGWVQHLLWFTQTTQ